MELTKLAQELKSARDDGGALTPEQERLASCAGSENFGYALFEGGYIKVKDWVKGDDLKRLEEAIKLVEDFKQIFEELQEEF